MKIIFFGSSSFSLPFLESLCHWPYQLSAVVTQPDRPKGRGYKISQTQVKELALKKKMTVFQPQDVNSQESIDFLSKINPDLFLVIAYGNILSQQVLEIPKIFAVNLHASLLPAYRGAAPIAQALIKGETRSGITIIKMDNKIDTGSILAQRGIDIDEDDDALTLEAKLCDLGRPLLQETLAQIAEGKFCLTPQGDSKNVSLAPKLKKADAAIDWKKSARQINNLIRGCLAWPVAFTYLGNKSVKIYRAQVVEGNLSKGRAGQMISFDKNGILLACGSGQLLIQELQLEGKKRMQAAEFISGSKLREGDIFISKK